jgi:hypothetical protein
LRGCPEQAWDERGEEPPFWQQAYHTLFYSDFYLSDEPRAFKAPAFLVGRMHDMDVTLEQPVAREQVLEYLEAVAAKLDAALDRLAGGGLEAQNAFPWTGPTVAHRLVYNLRHAQHHLGWMDSYASRRGGEAMEWVCSLD